MRQLAASRAEPSFAHFVVPATVGGVASGAAGYLARRFMLNDSRRRQDVASVLASTVVFWIFAGATWLVMTRMDD
jgi:hypothetical protein